MALMVLLSAFQLVDFAKDCGHGWQGCWPAEGRSNLRQILHRARVLYRGLVLRCRLEVPLHFGLGHLDLGVIVLGLPPNCRTILAPGGLRRRGGACRGGAWFVPRRSGR